jgi:hypothetical protein
VIGKRGSAGVPAAQPGGRGVVLVVAVVLRGAGRALIRLDKGVVSVEVSHAVSGLFSPAFQILGFFLWHKETTRLLFDLQYAKQYVS